VDELTQQLEESWATCLACLFKGYLSHPFAAHHKQFWEWLWAIEAKQRPKPFVGAWARGMAKSSSAEMASVALGARGIRKYGLYISETQEQADDHVGSVAGMLESRAMGRWYPEMADRAVGKFGSSKGWRRNRLRTRAGFTIDALGLDTASRGLKIEEDRPDLMILDDLDSDKDSAAATEKKLRYLQRRILPAGTPDVAVLAIQNVVNPDGIFARFIDGRADFLVDRIVSGPVPAIEDFEYEQREDRTVIISGRATWKGLDLDRCQDQIDTFGITAFLAEAQHVMPDPAGGMFDQLVYRHCSFDDVPPLDMVVCWVDPAVTDTDSSDSMGIQIDGLARDGTIYRLYSWEHRGSPEATIELALRKAKDYGAAHVGIETDQGGDTWRSVYAQAQLATGIRHIPMRWEKAGAGHGSKVHRASRMLTRYERSGFVHVYGTHDVLERALNRFPKTKPYDLVDAAVWAEFDLTRSGPVKMARPAQVEDPLRRKG
jgi:phage terminase large subunit-like protein